MQTLTEKYYLTDHLSTFFKDWEAIKNFNFEKFRNKDSVNK